MMVEDVGRVEDSCLHNRIGRVGLEGQGVRPTVVGNQSDRNVNIYGGCGDSRRGKAGHRIRGMMGGSRTVFNRKREL
jgi:hypothetical protein